MEAVVRMLARRSRPALSAHCPELAMHCRSEGLVAASIYASPTAAGGIQSAHGRALLPQSRQSKNPAPSRTYPHKPTRQFARHVSAGACSRFVASSFAISSSLTPDSASTKSGTPQYAHFSRSRRLHSL